MKSIDWRIRPGLLINEEEFVQSLKERGFYSSGIPRSDREKEVERGNKEPEVMLDETRST